MRNIYPIIEYCKNKIHFILFLLVVLFYCTSYTTYGYNDADDGFTLAQSWRIYNKEIPYRDFITVRPPISPILHSIIFYTIPEEFQIISDRIFSYILLSLSSIFGAIVISKVFGPNEIKLNKYLLASISFSFSVHNFPPMGWHTIDAIFFATIGLFFISRSYKKLNITLGILSLLISALCKQPFYLMPLMGILFIYFESRCIKKLIIGLGSLLAFILLFYFLLKQYSIIPQFISHTTGSTKLIDLIDSGILSYLEIPFSLILFSIVLFLILRKKIRIFHFRFTEKLYPALIIFTLLLFSIVKQDYCYTMARLLFLIAILFFLSHSEYDKKWLTLGFLLCISWCSSISWGYQTPVLFSMPLIFCFIFISKEYLGVTNSNYLGIVILTMGITTYNLAYQNPYCNPPKRELTYNIGQLFPKLKYIKIGKETYIKYSEFHYLISKYGSNFKTLPGMPLSNYVNNSLSPIKIDWVFNGETKGENVNIVQELENNGIIVFMEKKPQLIGVEDSDQKFNSSVAYYIKEHWKKIDTTTFFDVYKHDQK